MLDGSQPNLLCHEANGAFREMDFVRGRPGIEVQFGRRAFMAYNVCARLTMFHGFGHIDVGVGIVPAEDFAEQTSAGVSCFEQSIWDLPARGIADFGIPVLVPGIDHEQPLSV